MIWATHGECRMPDLEPHCGKFSSLPCSSARPFRKHLVWDLVSSAPGKAFSMLL